MVMMMMMVMMVMMMMLVMMMMVMAMMMMMMTMMMMTMTMMQKDAATSNFSLRDVWAVAACGAIAGKIHIMVGCGSLCHHCSFGWQNS
eukprot:8641896-Karenia_brevis.AAC.1